MNDTVIWCRRRQNEAGDVRARRLTRPKVLTTKSGVFFGRRGDWLVESSDGRSRWIVEADVFPWLYEAMR